MQLIGMQGVQGKDTAPRFHDFLSCLILFQWRFFDGFIDENPDEGLCFKPKYLTLKNTSVFLVCFVVLDSAFSPP